MDGRGLRDEGIDRVEACGPIWSGQAWDEVQRQRARYELPAEFTGEDLLNMVCARVGVPHHPNAKGAFIMRCVRAGLLVDTGRTVSLRNPSARARRGVVYRWAALLPTQVELL